VISFITATRTADNINDTADEMDFLGKWYFWQDDYLEAIEITNWNGSGLSTIREYAFTYYTLTVPAGSTDNFTRLLRTVTEYGEGGENAGHSLPSTTFGYTLLPNKGWLHEECFCEQPCTPPPT
jgi:hypothetical protein